MKEKKYPNTAAEATGELEHVGLKAETKNDLAEKIDSWADGWLRRVYEHGLSGDSMRNVDEVCENIAHLVGEEAAYRTGLFTRAYQDGMARFIEKLIDFVRTRAAQPSELVYVQDFASDICKGIFSTSPNIINFVPLEKMLILTARANRVPEISDWFGGWMDGELVYELGFSSVESDYFLNTIEKSPIADRLDFVHQLVRLRIYARQQGEEVYTYHVADHIDNLLEKLRDSDQSPLVRYACEAALPKISSTKTEDEDDFDMLEEQTLPDYSPESIPDRENLSKRVILNYDGRIRSPRVHRIAQDCVGIFDNTDLLRNVGMVDFERLPSGRVLAPESCSPILRAVEGAPELSSRDIAYLIDVITMDILVPQHPEPEDEAQYLGNLWDGIVPIFSAERWTEYFRDTTTAQWIRDDREQTQRREYFDAVHKETELFIQRFFTVADSIINAMPKGSPRQNDLKDALQEAQRFEKNDFERAFAAVGRYVFFLEDPRRYSSLFKPADKAEGESDISFYSQNFGAFASEALSLVEDMRQLVSNYAASLAEFTAANTELSPDEVSARERRNDFLNIAKTRQADFREKLITYLHETDVALRKSALQVRCESVDDLPNNRTLNPFRYENESEDLPLLLQYLHSGPIRLRIENDLGIQFSEIPLRSQIHFLRYLAGQSDKGFDRLRAVVREKSEISGKILNAFLATAEDMRYGETVLHLAEKLDQKGADAVFSKYDEITRASEKARGYLYENFQHQRHFSEGLVNRIVQNLLHRGNTLLESLARRADVDVRGVLGELENMKAEVLLFTSTFKGLKQELKSLDLREMSSVEFAISNSRDLRQQESTVTEMRRIYQDNYRNREKYPQKFADALFDSFDTSLDNPSTDFYIMKHRGSVASFCRFDAEYREGKLDHLYFGAVNTNPTYQQGRIGEALVEQALREKEQLGVPIIADCDPSSTVSKTYISLGFVATKFYSYEGMPSLRIEMAPDIVGTFSSKKLTNEKVIRAAATKEGLEGGAVVENYPAGTQPDFSLLEQGYTLTRYFEDKKSMRTYCVFERAAAAAQPEITAAEEAV